MSRDDRTTPGAGPRSRAAARPGRLEAGGLEALAASEARYRSLYEFAPAGYLTLEVDGTIAQANLGAARTLQVPRSELLGRNLSAFVAPADQDRWFMGRRQAAAGRDVPPLELALERSDGSRLHGELALAADAGRGGQPTRIRVAILDVSRRRRTEIARRATAVREILAEQRERRDLARVLHEDIAQDLAVLAMKLGDLDESRPAGGLEEVLAGLSRISQRLAAFGNRLFPSALFDLGIVAAAEWLAEDVEHHHGLKVTVAAGGEIADIDETARITLFRVLRELLRDAARRAGAEGATVRIWRADARVHLEVEDAGAGGDGDPDRADRDLLDARERLEQIGGSLVVRAGSGTGTRVRASLPPRIEASRVGGVGP